MLGDLDMLQCAQKDAPTMRRLSVELGHMQTSGGSSPASSPLGGLHASASCDIPNSSLARLRRASTSTAAPSSARSSMSADSSCASPGSYSASLPSSFYLDRVSSLLGRASSLPFDRNASGGGAGISAVAGSPPTTPARQHAAPGLPTIPTSLQSPASGGGLTSAQGAAMMRTSASAEPHMRVPSLLRSLSRGMDSFR
jgi:hypothetical protein